MKKTCFSLIFVFLGFSYVQGIDIPGTKGNVADTAEMGQLNASLKAVQNEKGPIVFKVGKADLDVNKCKTTLDTVAAIIKKYPRFLVQVEGHTDNVGKSKTNLTLSQKRAQAVVKWLIKSGKVNTKQLKAKGFGDTKPIADNKTEDGRSKNRRVEFLVSKL